MLRSFTVICLIFLLTGGALAKELNIIFDGSKETDAWLGLLQGIKEANTQGKFLNLQYIIVDFSRLADIQDKSSTIIVSARSARRNSELATKYPSIPIFSVIPSSSVQSRPCAKNILYTRPSSQVMKKVTTLWRAEHPNRNGHARLWHYTFKKYAAAQLNKRYKKTTDKSMSDESWSSWAAVKLFSDVAAKSAKPSTLLLNPQKTRTLAFDGQKGVDLNFNSELELLQPMLIIDNEIIVSEISIEKINALRDINSYCKTNLGKN